MYKINKFRMTIAVLILFSTITVFICGIKYIADFTFSNNVSKQYLNDKKTYESAEKLYSSGQYNEAKKLLEEDSTYMKTKAMISKYNTALIENTIKEAEKKAASEDYKAALEALNPAIKIDEDNSEIKVLVSKYENAINEETNKAKAEKEKNDLIAKHEGIAGYSVLVNIKEQQVNIFKDGAIIKTMVCSTGLDDSPTPAGEYKTSGKGSSFFSTKYQEGGFYWIRFMGDYLFHSVPFDKNENIISTEASKLGEKASHGCVRLSLEDAKWLYDTIPQWGTPITIQ